MKGENLFLINSLEIILRLMATRKWRYYKLWCRNDVASNRIYGITYFTLRYSL